MQINEGLSLHRDGCSTRNRSEVHNAHREGEASQCAAVKKSNIYGEAFIAFPTVGRSVGGRDEC